MIYGEEDQSAGSSEEEVRAWFMLALQIFILDFKALHMLNLDHHRPISEMGTACL